MSVDSADSADSADSHGGNVWAAARHLGMAPEDVLDFSASLNPLGPPAGLWRALARQRHRLAWYPDPACTEARAALARHLGVAPEAVLLGNGGNDLIHLLAETLAAPWALLPVPAYSEYARALGLAGTACHAVPLPLPPGATAALDPAPLLQALTALPSGRPRASGPAGHGDEAPAEVGAPALWLGQPVNPTGQLLAPPALAALAEAARERGVTLVLDAAFLPFVPGPAEQRLCQAVAGGTGLVVLGSLTKFYAVPGLRLGYVVAPPALIRALAARRDPWSVGVLAQAAVPALLAATAYGRRTQRLVAAARAELAAALAALPGVRVLAGAANFVCVDLRDARPPAATLAAQLSRQGILVRDLSRVPGLGPGFWRLAVRLPAENARLVAALAQVLGR